jgi:hypothetical protein
MTVETAGVPAQSGEPVPAAADAAPTAPAAEPEAAGLTLRVVVEADGSRRDGVPHRIRCAKDDGSPQHLALAVESPVAIDSLTRLTKLRCGCGAGMVLVFGKGRA